MFSMFRALGQSGLEVKPLGPMKALSRGGLRVIDSVIRKVSGHSYDYRHSFAVSTEYGIRFGRRLAELDVIFAPVACCEIGMLETDLPIVYMTDMLMADCLNYHPKYRQIFGFSQREAERIERRAMAKAASFLCPSNWTAQTATRSYGMPADRVHMIPFGANLPQVPSRAQAIAKRDQSVCRLLLLGVSWAAKGGAIALEVLQHLLNAGLNAELTVCGCVPPAGVSHPRLRVIPFLSKRDPAQTEQLVSLLCASSFLLLPTQAEAFGIVFCEASACGVPSIARNTGGVGGAVRDGVNGYKVPETAGPEAYARIILDLFRDRARYQALRVSSRDLYESRLNWDAWGRDTQAVIAGVAR